MNLQNEFAQLRDELESSALCVILVPAPEPMHSGHMVRMAVECNPAWYRDLCERFPSSRIRNRAKSDTRIKRRNVLRILDRLAGGKPSTSYILPYLIRAAQEVAKQPQPDFEAIQFQPAQTLDEMMW